MKYALFDMSLRAPAFDFIQFCIISKSRCAAMGEECYIIFKKGPDQGFKEPNDKPYSVEEKKFRMTHMLYPMCTLMGLDYSTEGNLEIFPSLKQSHMLEPEDNSYVFSQILKLYKKIPLLWPQPSEHAMEMVREEFPESPVVVTLRETYSAGRNSDLDAWCRFGKYIEKTNDVVFVRDTAKWNDRLIYEDTQFNTLPTASIDLDIRLALYKHAKINFSVGGGPTSLLRFSVDNSYRTFKMIGDKKKGHKFDIILSEKDIKLPNKEKRHIIITPDMVYKAQVRGRNKISVKDNKGDYQVILFGESGYVKEANANRPSSSAFLTSQGFPPGSQLPWHSKNQKIIWENDTFDNLKKEYDEWLKQYDKET